MASNPYRGMFDDLLGVPAIKPAKPLRPLVEDNPYAGAFDDILAGPPKPEEPGLFDSLLTPGLPARIGGNMAGGVLGAAAGTALAGPAGTVPGGVIGEMLGGAAGEYLGQKLEGQENVDPGEVALAGALSPIPFLGPGRKALAVPFRDAAGKVIAGNVAKKAALFGAEGAAQGALDAAVTVPYRSWRDEGEARLPTGQELAQGAAGGAVLGGGLGLGFNALAGNPAAAAPAPKVAELPPPLDLPEPPPTRPAPAPVPPLESFLGDLPEPEANFYRNFDPEAPLPEPPVPQTWASDVPPQYDPEIQADLAAARAAEEEAPFSAPPVWNGPAPLPPQAPRRLVLPDTWQDTIPPEEPQLPGDVYPGEPVPVPQPRIPLQRGIAPATWTGPVPEMEPPGPPPAPLLNLPDTWSGPPIAPGPEAALPPSPTASGPGGTLPDMWNRPAPGQSVYDELTGAERAAFADAGRRGRSGVESMGFQTVDEARAFIAPRMRPLVADPERAAIQEADGDDSFEFREMRRQARVGGEMGVNSDFYRGGQFLPSTELPKRYRPRQRGGTVEVEAWKREPARPGFQPLYGMFPNDPARYSEWRDRVNWQELGGEEGRAQMDQFAALWQRGERWVPTRDRFVVDGPDGRSFVTDSAEEAGRYAREIKGRKPREVSEIDFEAVGRMAEPPTREMARSAMSLRRPLREAQQTQAILDSDAGPADLVTDPERAKALRRAERAAGTAAVLRETPPGDGAEDWLPFLPEAERRQAKAILRAQSTNMRGEPLWSFEQAGREAFSSPEEARLYKKLSNLPTSDTEDFSAAMGEGWAGERPFDPVTPATWEPFIGAKKTLRAERILDAMNRADAGERIAPQKLAAMDAEFRSLRDEAVAADAEAIRQRSEIEGRIKDRLDEMELFARKRAVRIGGKAQAEVDAIETRAGAALGEANALLGDFDAARDATGPERARRIEALQERGDRFVSEKELRAAEGLRFRKREETPKQKTRDAYREAEKQSVPLANGRWSATNTDDLTRDRTEKWARAAEPILSRVESVVKEAARVAGFPSLGLNVQFKGLTLGHRAQAITVGGQEIRFNVYSAVEQAAAAAEKVTAEQLQRLRMNRQQYFDQQVAKHVVRPVLHELAHVAADAMAKQDPRMRAAVHTDAQGRHDAGGHGIGFHKTLASIYRKLAQSGIRNRMRQYVAQGLDRDGGKTRDSLRGIYDNEVRPAWRVLDGEFGGDGAEGVPPRYDRGGADGPGDRLGEAPGGPGGGVGREARRKGPVRGGAEGEAGGVAPGSGLLRGGPGGVDSPEMPRKRGPGDVPANPEKQPGGGIVPDSSVEYADDLRAYIEPPHDVREPEKVSRLAQSMRERGWLGRPLLILGDEGSDQMLALTGSHRLAAANEIGMGRVPVYRIESEALDAAAREHGLEDGAEALHQLKGRDDDEKATWFRKVATATGRKDLARAADLFDAEVRANESPDSPGSPVREPDLSPGSPEREANFQKWFQGSKVVDESGKPLVVYHGTTAQFERFDPAMAGRSSGTNAGRAIFFTDSPDVAGGYALRSGSEDVKAAQRDVAAAEESLSAVTDAINRLAKKHRKAQWSGDPSSNRAFLWLNDLSDAGLISAATYRRFESAHDALRAAGSRESDADPFPANAGVKPVYLSLKRPLQADANGLAWDLVMPAMIRRARDAGHDGLIVENVVDTADGSEIKSTVYVALKPEQIKSATGNRGTFDPSDPDIRFDARKPEGVTSPSVEPAELTRAGASVGGLKVRGGPVPNASSVRSEWDEGEFEVLPGVRSVPLSLFDSDPVDLFYAADDRARTKRLAEEIRQSGEIAPLIVAFDDDPSGRPFIVEGAHRLGALHLLGVKEFPAMVVDARQAPTRLDARKPQPEAGGAPPRKIRPIPPASSAEPSKGRAGNPTGEPITFMDEGRSSGEPPRVDAKVDLLREMEGEAALPPLRLDRDSPRTWRSLDPEIKRLITTETPDVLIRKAASGKINDAETMALDALRRGRMETFERAAAERLAGAPNAQDMLEQALQVAALDYATLARADVNAGTKIARALAARARIMKAGREPGDEFLRRVFREIDGVTDEQAAGLLRVMREDPMRLSDALREAIQPKRLSKFLELWKAGLVSAPGTQLANIAGNVGEQSFRLGETLMSAAVDSALSRMKGGERTRFAGEARAEIDGAASQVPGAWAELVKDAKAAFTLAPESLKLTEGQFDRQVGAISGKKGRAVRIPFRLLDAADRFFQAVGGGAELQKLAYRKAKQENPGASDDILRQRAQEIAAEALVPGKHPDLIEQVAQSRKERTFQNDPHRLAQKLIEARAESPWLNVVFPFVRTPANIAAVTLQRTPLGLWQAGKAYRRFSEAQKAGVTGPSLDKLRGEAVEAMARPLAGMAVMGGVAALAQAGLITGSGPADQREKNALRSAGWQPYSLALPVGNGRRLYVPLSRFEPISSLVGMAADAVEIKDQKKPGDMWAKLGGSVLENLVSKTYLTGFTEMSNAISDPRQFMSQYVQGLAGSLVPNVVAKVEQAADPELRDVRSPYSGVLGFSDALLRKIASRIPGASLALPSKKDAAGEDAAIPGNALTRFLSPVQPSVDLVGPEKDLLREMARIGYVPSAPRREFRHRGKQVTLNADEYESLRQADKRAAEYVARIIKSPAYRRLPDTIDEGGSKSKEATIKRYYERFRDEARAKAGNRALRRQASA